MTGIKLTHLYKAFTNIHAVDDVCLETTSKKFIVLAGPSGCGKSTLLHLIAGFIASDQGSVEIDGLCVNGMKPEQRGIAMVFQDPALFDHMSVFENIAIGLTYNGCRKSEIEESVSSCAKLLHIENLLERKADTLSNGQKQRVSMARALVRRPTLFLMDEPLSALDARLKSELRIELARVFQSMDATFLYVTHDHMEAMTLADILIIMKDGSFQQIGKPMEIYNNPCNLFTANFLGKYELNVFHATCSNQSIEFAGQCRFLPNSKENQKVLLGVRPEWIYEDKERGSQAKVVLVENLGDEVYYHMEWKSQIVIMKGTKQHICIGELRSITFAIEDALLFDKESEKRIF